jgi:tetratricopeptide (TPR) repeat protein
LKLLGVFGIYIFKREVSDADKKQKELPKTRVSVRAHTNAYLSAALALAFTACYFLYIDYELVATTLVTMSFLSFPILALLDRVTFDGKRIGRTGIVWRLMMKATGRRTRVKPREIVHVETEALRALRRGPNISYLYRTTFHTPEFAFEIGSGRGYRKLLTEFLPRVSEGCLDIRSIELRDHFRESWKVAARAHKLKIPSSDVLEAAAMLRRRERNFADKEAVIGEDDIQKAEELRSVGNQLRANGKMMQSLEAFRRALRLTPANGRLIYEFARCLQSLAAAKRDPWLERKSRAMLRLAERRSGSDGDLLMWLGETYFSLGAWSRAEKVFRKAVETETAGYRIFRGLGELAMRDGKIAHAINYFARSAEFARERPLSQWAQAEADYLRRINDDDEYMEVEIGRINLFDTFTAARRTSIRIFSFGLLVIAFGLFFAQDLITDIGWAVSGLSILIWLVASIMKSVFGSRIPFELLDKE